MTFYSTKTRSFAIPMLTEMVRILTSENSKQSGVQKNHDQNEDLADYVSRVVSKEGIAYREVVRRAKRKGHQITHSYISRIVSRAAQNPSIDKLRALAAGLNRPEEEVFAVARGEQVEDEAINDALAKAMLSKWSKMAKKDKDELASVVRLLDEEFDRRLRKSKR
jgi:transcriptional regulator with XRE-family HTH domain